MTSPRDSHERDQREFSEEPDFYDDQDDETPEGLASQDGQKMGQPVDDSGVDDSDIRDEADDDGMDDDMIDKISSSPSIDEGNSLFSILWPSRVDSIESGVARSSMSASLRDEIRSSSSPYVSPPEHYPIHFCNTQETVPWSHHLAKYHGTSVEHQPNSSPQRMESLDGMDLARFQEKMDGTDDDLDGVDIHGLARYLVPLDDPLLDVDEKADDYQNTCAQDSDWEDENENESPEADTSSNNDPSEFLFTNDSRFIDSGWGGECLREIEDIDFEFMYALHTFVATVEGQANATKGDTMVMLDDSNSYWWLVRVVKDGSIGELSRHVTTRTLC